jgi:hypothetical protein
VSMKDMVYQQDHDGPSETQIDCGTATVEPTDSCSQHSYADERPRSRANTFARANARMRIYASVLASTGSRMSDLTYLFLLHSAMQRAEMQAQREKQKTDQK